ncbi:dihydrofolate reductase family protein [Rhizomonospora bruguierae]|uniref:dihydrofolate reductase family protein n=1 Tax=Rhizomonospora bruguierae TaxID=1581705 RepID=UPI001BD074D2|nr:dihydrofolate reductase family protein [Micromonospora sp. NBRC 107566]
MTSAVDGRRQAILAALEQLNGGRRGGDAARLVAVAYRPPRPGATLAGIGGAITGQTAAELLQHCVTQARRHPGVVAVQRDLGVDAVALAWQDDARQIVCGMDRYGDEYLVVRQRDAGGHIARVGADAAATVGIPDEIVDQLAELVWRLCGPVPPPTGARIREVWPTSGATDLDDEALAERYAHPATGARHVRLLMVSTLDGVAAVEGVCGPISSPGDQRVYHIVKQQADLLMLGAATVRAERYGPSPLSPTVIAQRLARGQRPYPAIAVLTRSMDLDPDLPLFQPHAGRYAPPRPILIAPAAAAGAGDPRLAERAEILTIGERGVDLERALAVLTERGYRRIVCEGGPALAGEMAGRGLLDELCLTLAPKLLLTPGPRITAAGDGVPPVGTEWYPTQSLMDERGNLFLRYRPARPAS